MPWGLFSCSDFVTIYSKAQDIAVKHIDKHKIL